MWKFIKTPPQYFERFSSANAQNRSTTFGKFYAIFGIAICKKTYPPQYFCLLQKNKLLI